MIPPRPRFFSLGKIAATAFCFAVLGYINLSAQTAAKPAAASDDPLNGLNLGGGAPADSGPPSPFVAQFQGHLEIVDHGTPKDLDTASLKGVHYWAFYYSASWCGPCCAFSPRLVEFYNYFKKSHPNFEVILVGADRTQPLMEAYMKNDRMPWPSMKYPDLDRRGVSIKHYFGPGIPDLVLTDNNGKVLSDTFENGKYVGPSHVLDDIKKMVPQPGGSLE